MIATTHPRRTRLLGALLAATLLAGVAGCSRPPTADRTASVEGRLQRLLDLWRQRADIPAVTMAVDLPGRPRWLGASGSPERGGTTPAPPDARFRIASITKTFVATVALQLVQEGRLRLDQPLSEHLPGFPGAERVTIRQLLNHTSGIPDYSRTHGFSKQLLAHRDRRWTTAEILGLIAGRDRDFAPGTGYQYSNTDYVVLGQVIGAVTGSTWAQQVRRRILDPLDLADTYIAGAEPVPGGVLPGYFDADNDGDRENFEAGRPWPALETTEGPAGAIVSTVADLATFGDALFRGRLLAPTTLQQMTAEGSHHPRNSNYGLGLEIWRPDYRTTVWGHGGFLPGFKSVLWYVPSRDLVIVALANDSLANPSDLAELALRTALPRPDA
jgi:D-alanyl-D-alanine carboxypeptidase